MRVFVVYWHPEPQSFNAAMFRTICQTFSDAGHDVKMSDLQDMQFDPVYSRRSFRAVRAPDYFKPQLEEQYAAVTNGFSEDVESEIAKLEWCDLMIWQFPLWWFGLPATLKGWVDRVMVMGRTYGGGRYYHSGVFRGKRALLSLTTGSAEDAYRRGGFNGEIAGILRPIQRGILQFVGFDVLAPQVVYAPARMSIGERQKHLAAFSHRLGTIGDESAIEVGSY